MHPEAVQQPPVALPPFEPESASERIVQKTPWWGISLGLHVVMALVIGWFWVVEAAIEPEVVTVSRLRKTTEVPIMEERNREKSNNPDLINPVEKVVITRDPIDEKPQTEHNEPWNAPRGMSEDFRTKHPFNYKAVFDVMGTGGGAGGSFGGRVGGNKNRRAIDGGGGKPTEDAVLAALLWLARHQNPDGSWSVTGYTKRCVAACTPNPGEEDFDAGVTGLSLLAFLGAGYSHLSKDVHEGISFGDVVRKGLQWMMNHQDAEGCIGSRSAQKYMYNHTICALAMCEAFGLTGSTLFREQAQRGIDFLVSSQNPGKAWRYSYKSGDNDSSVTGWAVMVLKSAELSGLTFPPAAYAGTRAWYDEVTEEAYARVGYTYKGSGKVFIPGKNEHFDHHEALTAIAVMARIFIDRNKHDARLASGCDLLLRDKPAWSGNQIDFYYWYYASLALFQYDGPRGSKWSAWNEGMKTALVKHQNTASTGCRRGSWEPVDRWSCEGGRVYGTAINALTLEVYYRYANVFGAR